MRFRFLITFWLLFTAIDSQAQSFMHSAGATISLITGKVNEQGSSYSFSMTQTCLAYFPRYTFVENENSSFSIGMPVGIGFGLSNNYADDAGVYFAYDLPLVVDYNFGNKSTPDNEQNFGGYFGLGFGYYKVSVSQSAFSNYNGATYGPMARAGVRIGSSREGWNGHGFTVGVFYKKGLEKQQLNTFGFNVFYDF